LQPSHTLIDVGGGAGRFIQELRPLYPHVKGIVFDLPDIKESILPGCIFYGGNFFEFVPPADIYHFKRVLHDWSDEDCIKILQTCAASAKEGSRLVLHEFLLPQPEALMIDTYFMSLFRGRQRTQEEFATLLKTAG